MSIQPVQSNQNYSPVKKAAKTIATAAAVTVATGAVLYQASKTGKLNPKDGNKVIEGIKAALKKPADAIAQKADPMIAKAKEKIVASAIKSKITNSKVYTTVQPKVQNAVSTVSEKVAGLKTKIQGLHIGDKVTEKASSLKSKVQDLHIADKVSAKIDTLKDFVESKVNKAKFM